MSSTAILCLSCMEPLRSFHHLDSMPTMKKRVGT